MRMFEGSTHWLQSECVVIVLEKKSLLQVFENQPFVSEENVSQQFARF